eukprot:3730725-Rhodomonas_salina.1
MGCELAQHSAICAHSLVRAVEIRKDAFATRGRVGVDTLGCEVTALAAALRSEPAVLEVLWLVRRRRCDHAGSKQQRDRDPLCATPCRHGDIAAAAAAAAAAADDDDDDDAAAADDDDTEADTDPRPNLNAGCLRARQPVPLSLSLRARWDAPETDAEQRVRLAEQDDACPSGDHDAFPECQPDSDSARVEPCRDESRHDHDDQC